MTRHTNDPLRHTLVSAQRYQLIGEICYTCGSIVLAVDAAISHYSLLYRVACVFFVVGSLCMVVQSLCIIIGPRHV